MKDGKGEGVKWAKRGQSSLLTHSNKLAWMLQWRGSCVSNMREPFII